MAHQHYDLLVIGSGLAGQKGDINAAKRGNQVALLERDGSLSVTEDGRRFHPQRYHSVQNPAQGRTLSHGLV